MPLNDPVPSSAFDVLQRNAEDLDKYLNQDTGSFQNRTGDVLTPIPVVVGQVDAAKTQAIADIGSDVGDVETAKNSALSNISQYAGQVDTARIAGLADIASDVAAVESSKNAAASDINADVATIEALRLSSTTLINADVNEVDSAKNTAINTTIPGYVAAVQSDANTAINTEIPAIVSTVQSDAATAINIEIPAIVGTVQADASDAIGTEIPAIVQQVQSDANFAVTTEIPAIVADVDASSVAGQADIAANVAAVQDYADNAINIEIPAQIARLGLEYPPVAYTAGLTLDSYTKTYSYSGAIYIWGGTLGTVTTGAFDETGWQPVQGDLQLRSDVTSGSSLIKDVKHTNTLTSAATITGAYEGQLFNIVSVDGNWSASGDRPAGGGNFAFTTVAKTPDGVNILACTNGWLVRCADSVEQSSVIGLADEFNKKITIGEAQPPRFAAFGGQLKKLKKCLSDPLQQRVGIVFLGDSITWGRTLPENLPTDPRSKQLTDPRDGYASPSWVNEVKRYIGQNYANGDAGVTSNWVGSPSGEAIVNFESDHLLYPREQPFSFAVSGSSQSATEAAIATSPTGYQFILSDGDITRASYQEVSFNFTGDQFTLVYTCVNLDAGKYDLYVDGVLIGNFDTSVAGGAIDGRGDNRIVHTFGYVRDKAVTIRTNNTGLTGTRRVRLSGIEITKKITVTNNGINGADALSYFNNAIPAAITQFDNFAFLQLGTNDRISVSNTPKGVQGFQRNLTPLVDQILLYSDLIIMCAPPVTNSAPPTYSFDMQQARGKLIEEAERRAVDFVDNYSAYIGLSLSDYLADGVHPNEKGHAIIKRNIIGAIEQS